VKAGGKVEVKLQIERRWPDLKNAITVAPLSFPGSIRANNVEVPADKKEAALTLQVQAGTPAGEYTLTVTGQMQVPFSKDADAKQKPNTLVTQAARPLTLIVKP
jgi:hypothetical protein